MNPNLGQFLCLCNKSFGTQPALTFHKRSCDVHNRRIASAAAEGKSVLQGRKKRRLNALLNTAGNVESRSANHNVTQGDAETITMDIDPASTSSANLGPILNMDIDEVPSEKHLPATLEVEPASIDEEDLSTSIASRRKRRKIRLPRCFRDALASPLSELAPDKLLLQEPTLPPAELPPNSSPVHRLINSSKNVFGLFRRYLRKRPDHDPEELVDLEALADNSTGVEGVEQDPTDGDETTHSQDLLYYPFPNKSSLMLGHWYISDGHQKSMSSLKKLVEVVGSEDFKPADVRKTRFAKAIQLLGVNQFDDERLRKQSGLEGVEETASWQRKPIHITVPFNRRDKNPGPKDFYAGEFYHRSLVSVIREKLANSRDDAHFHYQPYELYWEPRPNMENPIRVHGELYTSPAFLDAHNELQDAPGEPGCTLPRVVVAMMFASDATHLTTSGDSKLWPCYLYFGNESKYRRSKPTCKLANHVAYFQTLPDKFKDFAAQHSGTRGPTRKLYTHCRREIFHAQWEILLDDEFLEAYQHGIVIECCDGVKRRFYPRIFTYSADYPEKVIISSIRDKGQCPCPRCLVLLTDLDELGTPADMQRRIDLARVDDASKQKRVEIARGLILNKNYALSSKAVEEQLKALSLTPTDNAFSKRLAPLGLGFNIYLALVVDLMHEFELGVWKSLFIHILKILQAHSKSCGSNVTNLLDSRYRKVPSFGRDTIRRFSNNVSELKQLAARDYEDLLQCAIPVLDGLLPEPHNSEIMTLLFVCAHWHALAKLRMHNDYTLQLLDGETLHIGDSLRSFARETCEAFNTQELKREIDARKRRQQKNQSTRPSNLEDTEVPRRKIYNIKTIKNHFLGDHGKNIRLFGTSDSYSTEAGELEHKTPKKRYVRTSGKDFVKQMTGIERREIRVRHLRERLYGKEGKTPDEPATQTMDVHHHIGVSQHSRLNIGTFLRDNAGDPAIKDFYSKLKANILPRILRLLKDTPDLDYSRLPEPDDCDADRSIVFKDNVMYSHQILRINYTTYDVRRQQDVINDRSSHCNFMVLCDSDDDDMSSPHFRYGRVLGTYHLKAIYTGPGLQNYNSHRMEFLWVRWYDQVGHVATGWDHRRLDRVRFAPLDDDDAFGILDPSDVLRGSHIIPRFSLGLKYNDSIGLSDLARDSSDWKEYYVNRFVDRDMMMRYHFGLGVGHAYSHGFLHAYTSNINVYRSESITPNLPTHSYPNVTPPEPAPEPADQVIRLHDAQFEDEDEGEDEDYESSLASDSLAWDDSESDEQGGLEVQDDDFIDVEEIAAEEMYYNLDD